MGLYDGDLKSPMLNSTTKQLCFSFYYYLFGQEDIISLTLYSYQTNQPNQRDSKVIWVNSFSDSDLWRRKFITIQPQKYPFNVRVFMKFTIDSTDHN